MITHHTSGRRYGRTNDMISKMAEALKKGETLIVADRDLKNRDYILHQLILQCGVDVECEQVTSMTPMRIVYDGNDPSPEPGYTMDYGHEVRFGFKLKLKSDGC